MTEKKTDFLVIGAGVVGLALARSLRSRFESASIMLIEKESGIAEHSSGRNSGVLHAGFYYSADSLKAKFTVEGNRALRAFCAERGLPINTCGKLVVARNFDEKAKLRELLERGRKNGSEVHIVSAAEAQKIEPNVRTFEEALYSPCTAVVDPGRVCAALKDELGAKGVEFIFESPYLGRDGRRVITANGSIEARFVINAAGLYADRIARDFGFGKKYTIIPFKGIYLKYTKDKTSVRTNIYPVPNLKNPFLGVHFTKTVDGTIKIGPTAIPAFWRENYSGLSRFSLSEAAEIVLEEARLFIRNSFNFRALAFEEMNKYVKRHFVGLAQELVQHIDPAGFTEYSRPGIRAQLLNKETRELVQDFVIEGDRDSVHVLNAVSPGFTCSLPFAEHVIQKYVQI